MNIKNNNILVSVGIPVVKSIYLSSAIESCLNQKYTFLEIIILNNASTNEVGDEIELIVKKFDDKRLKYYEVMLKYLGEISGLDSVGVNEVINQILEGGSYILKSNLTLEETNPISTRLDEFGIIYNIRQQKKGKV